MERFFTTRGAAGGGAVDRVDHERAEFDLAVEQHLAFVGEVAEVGALRDTGALGDLGGGRGVVTAVEVKLESCLSQSVARFRAASRHPLSLRIDSHCRNDVASATVATSAQGEEP